MRVLTNAYISSKSIYPEAPVSTGAYGVERDMNDSSSAWTRIGNMEAHRTLPIQSQYYGCIYNLDTKQEVYKLDPNNWAYKEDGTASILDGTDGCIKVHIPHFYGRTETDGTIQRIWMALEKDDFHDWVEIPEMYVDAWETSLQKSTQKLMCVVNNSDDWRGGYDHANYAGMYDSSDNVFQNQHNKPITYKSITQFRQLAQGSNQEVLGYVYYLWIFYYAYIVEYANNNCQLAYTSELTPEGFHQGGLGNGLTSFQNWTQFNKTQPIVPNGYENSIGNGTGVMSIPEQNWIADLTSVKTMNRYSIYGYNCSASHSTNLTTITESFTSTGALLGLEGYDQPNTAVYHVDGLTESQELIFYVNSRSNTITTATSNGDITVNWPTTNQGARYIGVNFVGPCNISISLVSAEDLLNQQYTSQATNTCRWRGFSNPFGHIWRLLDGIFYQGYEEDGELLHRNVYVTMDSSKYGNIEEHELVSSNMIYQDGYIKTAEIKNNAFVPTAVGGGSLTYFCDYLYQYTVSKNTDANICFVGGHSGRGSRAGFGYFDCYWSVSTAALSCGARCISIP